MNINIDENFYTRVTYSHYNQVHTLKWKVEGWLNHCTITLLNKGQIKYKLNDDEFILKEGQLLLTTPPQNRLLFPLTPEVNVSVLDFHAPRQEAPGYKVFTLNDTSYVNHLIGEATKERISTRISHLKMCDALAMQLVIHLMRLDASQVNPQVEQMKTYILDHYTKPLSATDLSRQIGFSESYCGKLFKKYEGCSIPDYINSIRINNAKIQFASGEESVHKVATQCGYTDSFYFSRVFKTHTGMSPSAFINKTKK
ncbi:MAG: helix-turn-helix transcriptional regulator [Clostridia bacterium]|nr:helix-turn-helix transcriptional regulator [Clostridia bacterium]